MSKTLQHPNYLGNGDLRAIISERTGAFASATGSTALDCIYLTYSPEIPPAGTPAYTPHAATVTVTASTNVITLKVKNHNAAGAANSDVSFTITPASAKAAWSSGAASAYTLKDVIDLINEDDAGGTNGKMLSGFKASIGPGGMYDLLVDQTSAGFQAESEKYIMAPGCPAGQTGFFKMDSAVWTTDSDYLFIKRLGMPEVRDRGLFKLLDLYGAIGTDTGATLYVVKDDVDDYVQPTGTWATDFANHQEFLRIAAASVPAGPGGTNGLVHNPVEAPVFQGPLVLVLKGDTGTGQTVDLVALMQAVS